jgi:hypothetical protein
LAGDVNRIPPLGASVRADGSCIRAINHKGIGLPPNIPGGLSGSAGGNGKFGLRGVMPAGEAVQFPKRFRHFENPLLICPDGKKIVRPFLSGIVCKPYLDVLA